MKLEEIFCLDDVEKLLVLRKRLGLKQHELARIIGIHSNYLSAIESYKAPLTTKMKDKINQYIKESKVHL